MVFYVISGICHNVVVEEDGNRVNISCHNIDFMPMNYVSIYPIEM